MKKNFIALVLFATLLTPLTGCGNADNSPSEATTQESTATVQEDSQDNSTFEITMSEENQTAIENTLQAIASVQSGSDGDSLRQMKAAAMLLDLSETLTDQTDASEIAWISAEWFKANPDAEAPFDEAYLGVKELALNYMNDPEAYGDQITECGYSFTHPSHTEDYVSYVTNYIEISRNKGE